MDDDDEFFTTTEAAAKARSSPRWLLAQEDAPVIRLNKRKLLWPKRRYIAWLHARGLQPTSTPSSGDTTQHA